MAVPALPCRGELAAPVDAGHQFARPHLTAAEVAHVLFVPESESGATAGVA
jgi:hypothetical protein